MTAIDPSSEKLHFTTKLAYGAGDLGPAITANISVFYLLFFLTNVAGLSPALAGSVLMIGKIADAINDPIIGTLTDRTHTRWGRRLPWMIGGAIPFGLIYLLQWLIPTTNQWLLFAYYVLIGVLFNIAYTMINLPYQALTPELTTDYNERTSLNSFRFAFSLGGSILSLILYLLIEQAYGDNPRVGFFFLAVICALLSVIAVFWCAFSVQERGTAPLLNFRQKKATGTFLMIAGSLSLLYGLLRGVMTGLNFTTISATLLGIQVLAFGFTLSRGRTESHLMDAKAIEHRQQTRDTPAIGFREQLAIAFGNRPFLYVIGIYLCSWLAVQLTASIIVYYVVSYMKLPQQQSGLVGLAVQGTALLMLFVWQAIARRLDKKTVYYLGMVFWIIAQIGLYSLQPGQVREMYFLAILAGIGISVAYLIPWSMIPDVIDLDELRTGQRREGIFYAFMVLLQKIGLALGLFLVGIALEAAGLKPQVAGEAIPVQPESALVAIRLVIAPLPAFFLMIGLILAYLYPITREAHREILAKLADRQNHRAEA
jgi:glycoside/pentoside/hexuronide:cation symporter, GPH family